MYPARCRTHRSSDIFEECYDIVIGALFDLEDLRNRKARPLSDFNRVSFRNLAELCHRLAGEQLDLKPDLEFALVRPNVAHPRARVTIDHAAR